MLHSRLALSRIACLRLASVRAALPPAGAALRRTGLALLLLGLVAWTQLFLGYHELSHLGQRDTSSCSFALIHSTVGGATASAAPSLSPPSELGTLAPLALSTRELVSRRSTQQARAPPLFA